MNFSISFCSSSDSTLTSWPPSRRHAARASSKFSLREASWK